MDDEFERTPIAEPDGDEMTHIACGDSTNPESFCQRNHRPIHQAEPKIRVTTVDFQGSRELALIGWSVDERAAGKILHERLHRPAFVAEEIIELGQYQAWHVASARPVDGAPEQTVVGCARDEVVEERASVADQRSRATGWH